MIQKTPPKWFENTYGNDAAVWEEARAQCRNTLIIWARAERISSYGDLAREITAINWPEGAYTHHGGQIGSLLGQVSVEEWLEDRPLLSALAILAGDSEPSYGFYSLCDQLRISTGSNKEAKYDFWWQEVQRCHNYWGSH
jgi:hypothetical protein